MEFATLFFFFFFFYLISLIWLSKLLLCQVFSAAVEYCALPNILTAKSPDFICIILVE